MSADGPVERLARRLLDPGVHGTGGREESIRSALEVIGRAAEVERISIFLFSHDGSAVADIWQWASPGVAGHDFDALVGVTTESFPWTIERLRRGETILVADPESLPPEAAAEAQACASLSIRSYVALPLFHEGILHGSLSCHATGTPRTWSAEQVALLARCGDLLVTAVERHRSDERRFRSEELSLRLASLGTLAAGLAHEVVNPLAYVLGNLAYLHTVLAEARTHLPAAIAGEAEDVLSDAREGAEKILGLVRDLRTFTRRDAETPGPVDLLEVLDFALRMASNEIRHRARVHRKGDGPAWVLGTASQLGQVFLTLLLESARSIPPGRADEHLVGVTIRRDDDGGGAVTVEVSHTGDGIAPERLPRLFDPFFTTRSHAGGGVGLALCHHIVTSFGGEIGAESALGGGTAFRVRLRGAVPPADLGEDALTPPASGPGRAVPRVLIVDDDRVFLKWVRRALRSCEVQAVTNGREALALLARDADFDLVLVDVMMPELTGEDVFEAVLREHPHLGDRVVFITAGTFAEPLQAFLRRVPNRRLHKPFAPEVVLELLEER